MGFNKLHRRLLASITLVLLVLNAFTLFFQQVRVCEGDDYSRISGLFGPGAYLGWLLTALDCIWDRELSLLVRPLWMIASDSQPTIPMQDVETGELEDDLDHTESMHYDSSVLATTSYPLVAFLYIIGLTSSGNMTEAIYEAVLLCCRMGVIIHAIGIQAFLLASIFRRSAHQTVPYVIVNTFEAVLRPLSWMIPWGAITGYMFRKRHEAFWSITGPVWITFTVASVDFSANEYRPGTVISLYSTIAIALITTVNSYRHTNEKLASQACKLRIRVIPPSSAKLTDLDQIVALVIASIWFCGARVRQLYSQTRRWLRANH